MPPPPRAPELPPLNALRAFEAAARHASMTSAAHELGVTQTAVSHQVRLLEDWLSPRLFVRLPGRLELTAAGRAWAGELREVFARLHGANRRLRAVASRARPVVSITAIPSFAAGWLVPHLAGFFARHKDLDVRISPSERLVDLEAEDLDHGLRYGHGRYGRVTVERLFADRWLVVCAPALAAGLRSVAELHRAPLLRDDEPDGWPTWLAANGGRRVTLGPVRELTDSSMVVDLAARGQGVALVRWSLAADALAAGRVVQPFPRARAVPTGRAYYLVSTPAALARPEVAAFRAWLLDEIAASLGA